MDPTDADTNPTPGTMTPAPAVPPKCPAADFDCNSCLAVSGCIFVDHKVSKKTFVKLFVGTLEF